MKKIIKGSGEGKTKELIQLSHDTNTYILVTDRSRQREVFKFAHDLGIDILFPVTVEDYLKTKFRGSFINHILIDDADEVLKVVFSNVEIDAITMRKDEE